MVQLAAKVNPATPMVARTDTPGAGSTKARTSGEPAPLMISASRKVTQLPYQKGTQDSCRTKTGVTADLRATIRMQIGVPMRGAMHASKK